MLKHVIDIFNVNLLNSITDSDSQEDENSKSLIGYGTFLCSQENNTFDESITYNTNEQPKQPIDSTSDSLTDFDNSKGNKIKNKFFRYCTIILYYNIHTIQI